MLKKVRIALIPAYQPESCLEKIVCEVRKEGFQAGKQNVIRKEL